MRASSVKRGFTLIELLVVISIIALLISLLLPALGRARASAEKTKALAQIKGIATMTFNYSSDNLGWFPYNNPVPRPDNTSQYASAGYNIYGVIDNSTGSYATERRDLLGLGALPVKGRVAVPEPHMVFGDYMSIDFLFSPESAAYRRNHPNGDGLAWFGHMTDATVPLGSAGPGGYWTVASYGGFYYMTCSYSYRHGLYVDLIEGTTGGDFNDVYENLVNGPRLANLNGQAPENRNLREDAPGLSDRSFIAEHGGRHPKVGGGNYALRDGSGHFFKNDYYAAGYYTKNNAVGEPLDGYNMGIGASGDHHGIFPNLIHAAIDSHRLGESVPGE